jgi:hypothetical protein
MGHLMRIEFVQVIPYIIVPKWKLIEKLLLIVLHRNITKREINIMKNYKI